MTPDVRRPIDRLLLFSALMLMAVGMVWIYSASALKADQSHAVATAYLVRQLVAGLIGVGLMLALSQVELVRLRDNPRLVQVLYVLCLFPLVAVFFFHDSHNAHRWIRVAWIGIQPSELWKPLSVLIVSWWMVHYADAWDQRQDSIPKLLILFGILMLPLALILKEPDFGTTFLILFVAMWVIFLGGAPRWTFAVVVPILIGIGLLFIVTSPYRLARVTSFLHPEADPLGKGHQALQSLIAVGNGGLTGVGIGASMQKLHYLPEAHTDFIYAVIGEETGLIGTVIVLALFVTILWRGYRVARMVRDNYLKLCAMGLTLLLVVQALMNMSVVLSIAPNKGIPLPFISYGGTSLIVSLMCLGLLLSISKEAGA